VTPVRILRLLTAKAFNLELVVATVGPRPHREDRESFGNHPADDTGERRFADVDQARGDRRDAYKERHKKDTSQKIHLPPFHLVNGVVT